MKPEITKTSYNLIAIIGWLNVIVGALALLPAIFGKTDYSLGGAVFGIVIGAIIVTVSEPVKSTKNITLE